MELKPNFDIKDLARQATMFPIAGARAINKVTKSARAQVAKDVRGIYKMKSADIKETIEIQKASRTNLTGKIMAKGKRIALYLFNARQTKKGVTVAITKGGRKLLKGAFIATMKSGHIGVFRRKGEARNPIEEKYTISTPEMMGSKAITDKFNAHVEQELPKVLEHEIKYFKESSGD